MFWGPGGVDLGRLGALRLLSGPRGSSEYFYVILGLGGPLEPPKMAKRWPKVEIWA